jgi:hypothetical protein
MTTGTQARDQYGKTVTVLAVVDNVVWTTGGVYHVTKLFAVK